MFHRRKSNVPLVYIRYSTSPHILLFHIYTDEWFRFDLGPRDSPRNSGVNRTEINRDPPQQAKPTDSNVINLNKSRQTLTKKALQVPKSSIRSSLSSVYHDALAAPVCEDGETLPKNTVPKSSIRSSLSSVYHDALAALVCEDGGTLPKNTVPRSSIRSSVSSVYHDALTAPVCEDGETLPKNTVPRSSIRSNLSSHLSVYHDALTEPELVCEESKNGETPPKTAVPFSSTRSSMSSVYHDALTAPLCEDGETLPKNTVPRTSIRSSHLSVYHDALMEPGETSPKTAVPFSVPPATTMTMTTSALLAQNTNEEDSRLVRFGGVKDVDRGIEKRVSLEKEQRVIGTYPIFYWPIYCYFICMLMNNSALI